MWSEDEEDDMRELLRNRPTILEEVDRDQSRRLTVQENMAVLTMYGGVMFPGGELVPTPPTLLYRVRTREGTEPPSRRGSRSSSVSSRSR